MLKAGKHEAALQACRAHLSWYVLCHRAHTIPLLEIDNPKGQEILVVDIEALDAIVSRLAQCYRKTGRINQFGNVLDQIGDAIDDERWKAKLNMSRFHWLMIDCDDKTAAAAFLGDIDVKNCDDEKLLQSYFFCREDTLTFIERQQIEDRICELSKDPIARFQFQFIKGIDLLQIDQKDDAIEIMRAATDRYVDETDEEDAFFGNHLLAHARLILGFLTGDASYVEQAETLFRGLIGSTALTELALSEYWMWVGRCRSFQEDWEAAEKSYDASVNVCPNPLAVIYKSESLGAQGKLDEARELIESVEFDKLPVENRHDYALARVLIAVKSAGPKDVELAKTYLRSFDANSPQFRQQRDKWLLALAELKQANKPNWAKGTIRAISRYISMKPSILGFGVDLNNVIDDLTGRDA